MSRLLAFVCELALEATLATVACERPARADSDAPSATPSSFDRSATAASPGWTRIGVFGGLGFPNPINVEGLVEIKRVAAIGVEYGLLPGITIDGVNASLDSLAVDLRAQPFGNGFFVGMRTGHEHVGATTTVTVESFGSATEVLKLDSWFVNPRVGYVWVSKEGLAVGIDAGVQIPIHPGLSSSLPLSLDPGVQRTVETLGSSLIPTVDLLRVGLLL